MIVRFSCNSMITCFIIKASCNNIWVSWNCYVTTFCDTTIHQIGRWGKVKQWQFHNGSKFSIVIFEKIFRLNWWNFFLVWIWHYKTYIWYKQYLLRKLSGVYLMIYTYEKYFYEKQIKKLLEKIKQISCKWDFIKFSLCKFWKQGCAFSAPLGNEIILHYYVWYNAPTLKY